MKKFVLLLALISAVSYAGGSKIVKIDLDDNGTQLVKADLDLDDIYYYMDTTACVCWVTKVLGGSSDLSVFDCKNLSAYSKFEPYVSKCFPTPKVETAPVTPTEETKVEEVKKEEPKKDKKSK